MKRYLKPAFSALAVMLFINLLNAGVIRGRVVDSKTGDPLIGANLILAETAGIGAASDFKGYYRIDNVPAGEYTLKVTFIGYQPVEIKVSLKADETIIRDIEMVYGGALKGEEVVVTAQAKGQMSAINQQLASNVITNIVDESRIQELPDVNAAESIGRLPGVSIQRSGGEANKVEVRGLNPKYSLITVNGVELPATGSEDRSVNLSLISSNMLDGIVLKKTNTPDMDADVLGGTIDLRLKEAPEGFKFNLSAQGGYNQLQNYYGNYNFTASVSNRFFDNRLGIIVNANTDNYDRSADKLRDNWRNYNEMLATGELFMIEEIVNRKRTGASLLLDYNLPKGKITANGFFNQLNSDGLIRNSQVNTMELGYATNRHYYRVEEEKSKTNVFTSAIGINQDFGWFRYDAGVSYSGTNTDSPDRRVTEFVQEQSALRPGYPQFVDPKALVPYFNVDTINTNMASLYSYSKKITENTSSAKLNLEIPFRFGNILSGSFKTGGKLRWIDRSNDENQHGYSGLQYGSGQQNPVFLHVDKVYPEWGIMDNVEEYQLLNVLPFLKDYSRPDFLNGDFPLGLTFDEKKLHKMSDALMAAPDSLNLWLPYSVGTFGYDYDGFERYQAAYFMGEFNFGSYLTLIPGVRYEKDYSKYHGQRYMVNQSGQTVEQPPSEFVRLTKERENEFWLPMVNIIAKPTNWLNIRLARTETIARPDFLRYAPISYISSDRKSVNAANYSLRPSQSTNYDVGVSLFNNEIGLLSVTGFHKNIEDLIFYSAAFYRPGVVLDSALDIPQSWLKANPQINAYRNNPDPAKYYGYEIEWQTHFWYLPSVFKGIVLNINYTHIYSEMKLVYDSLVTQQVGSRRVYSLVPAYIKTRMPDQPAHVFNITIGYDLKGFSARLSYLFQTDKLTGIGYDGVIPTTRLSSYTSDYGRWDLTLQQKLFQNIQLFANFNNLNNRYDQSCIGADLTHPSYIEYYGFTMDLGIRVNL